MSFVLLIALSLPSTPRRTDEKEIKEILDKASVDAQETIDDVAKDLEIKEPLTEDEPNKDDKQEAQMYVVHSSIHSGIAEWWLIRRDFSRTSQMSGTNSPH